MIADRCEAWQPTAIQQERLARLLDVDRTKLSKLKKKTGVTTEWFQGNKIDILVREFAKRHKGTTDADDATDGFAVTTHCTGGPHFSCASVPCEQRSQTVDEMWTYAGSSLGYSPEQIRTYSRRYEALVLETGFDDFERLLRTIEPVASQCWPEQGSLEREDFVSRVQRWAEDSSKIEQPCPHYWNVGALALIPVSPKLVCTNEEEVRVTMKFLSQLGAASSQLQCSCMAIVEDNGKKMYRLNTRRLPGRQHEQAGEVHGSKCARYLSRFTKRKEARFRMDGIFIARSSVCTCSVVLATIEVINRDGRPRPLRIAPSSALLPAILCTIGLKSESSGLGRVGCVFSTTEHPCSLDQFVMPRCQVGFAGEAFYERGFASDPLGHATKVRMGLFSITSRCFDIAGFGNEVHRARESSGVMVCRRPLIIPVTGIIGLQVGSDRSFPSLLCPCGKTARGHTKDGWFGKLLACLKGYSLVSSGSRLLVFAKRMSSSTFPCIFPFSL